ncbi:hypothetical protein DPX39_000096800 [Trypanosoma brucei equiperdum]|uniref:Uncharacterized protein n=1 Tax=Trypanosoma brucei equiperdum TaxID=630700 RepID=A0A3L6KQH7_9TRYP|nr:hypothetical protein DPX39_000089700 [Trypanosoma brucei equiperdum]RHW66837.1 hypothetical protein DPX39_000090600 [Trypanosoma brucei equiperdum]RHW66860.1 hypothetical protein DPX39_000107200 [Trypanosoma brucei equiperdum]RHW66867.1 hypothetical protein DPX39_000086500 [Trypanosoma brucei equiperdum]RHW66869.1 hypothetical protein DPX39_000103100 [Trypanosoma brucei equiperdum]
MLRYYTQKTRLQGPSNARYGGGRSSHGGFQSKNGPVVAAMPKLQAWTAELAALNLETDSAHGKAGNPQWTQKSVGLTTSGQQQTCTLTITATRETEKMFEQTPQTLAKIQSVCAKLTEPKALKLRSLSALKAKR